MRSNAHEGVVMRRENARKLSLAVKIDLVHRGEPVDEPAVHHDVHAAHPRHAR